MHGVKNGRHFFRSSIAMHVWLLFATLGDDADRKKVWQEATFRIVTTLVTPTSREMSTTIFPVNVFDDGRLPNVAWPRIRIDENAAMDTTFEVLNSI